MGNATAEPDPDPSGPAALAAAAHPHAPGPSAPHAGHLADPTEFGEFYRKSAPRLVAFLRWQGAPLPDAAECAQEALTQAFQRWSSIEHPHAWCRQVASRLYARRVASTEELTENLEERGTPLLPAGTDIDALEGRHAVLSLLARLPPRQRQVMAWTYDGASPTEIAAALKITPETVRSNLHKARTALRNHLQDSGGEIR